MSTPDAPLFDDTARREIRFALLRAFLRVSAVAALLITVFAFAPLAGDHWWIGFVVGLVAIASVAPLTVRRAMRVRTSPQPLIAAIEALLMLLTILVLGFSAVYVNLNRDGDGTAISGMSTRLDAVYFTVTTLSTVGFGDLHADSQAARAIVTAQMLIDLAFIGLALKLVTFAARKGLEERRSLDLTT